jgi:hypothetical protein
MLKNMPRGEAVESIYGFNAAYRDSGKGKGELL